MKIIMEANKIEIVGSNNAEMEEFIQSHCQSAKELWEKRHLVEDKKDEILQDGVLEKGTMMMLAGITGFGKTSFVTQMGYSLGAGIEWCGFRWRRPMGVLIVQGENTEKDLLKFQAGAVEGLGLERDRDRLELALFNVHYLTLRGVSGKNAARHIVQKIKRIYREYGLMIELIIIDPAFEYLSAAQNDSGPIGDFLRRTLRPMAMDLGAGVHLNHHFPKPPKGDGGFYKDKMDWVYAASGSAELVNPMRAVFTMFKMPGQVDVYDLTVNKKIPEMNWRDGEGNLTQTIHVQRHPEGKMIWTRVFPELEGGKWGQREAEIAEAIVSMIPGMGMEKKFLLEQVVMETGCGDRMARKVLGEMRKQKEVVEKRVKGVVVVEIVR